MRDVPAQRPQTARIWLRSLLASAAYGQVKPLAAKMLMEDPGQRAAWLHALLFAARETTDPAFLTLVLEQGNVLPDWCRDLLAIERAILLGQPAAALPRLTQYHRIPGSIYVPYYQVDRLIRLGHPEDAQKLLTAYGANLAPDEAAFLLLRIYQAKDWPSLVDAQFESVLQLPLAPRVVAQFCAFFLGHPHPAFFARFCDKFTREGPPLSAETLPLFQAVYLAAKLAGDEDRAAVISAQISRFTGSDPRVVRGLAELLLAGKADGRLARILPLVSLPTEVVYAALERPQAPVKP